MSESEKAAAQPSFDEGDLASPRSSTLGRRVLTGGRLGTYTVLGAATGIVPLPWVPDAMVRRVRGALVHDITARHNLSLTPEARKVLVEPAGSDAPRGFVQQGMQQGVKFAIGRVLGRLGPLALISPVRTALGTFVLGHLLHRYLDILRQTRSVRIDVEEARRVRRAIDQSLVYALTTEGRGSREDPPIPMEDLRDPTTQVVDGVIISIASAPGWLVRRLEAAFDETIATVRP